MTRELAPDLEVVRELGAGKHAAVFLAREPALKRLVAVKVLHPEMAADRVLRRRFEREAQAAARIVDPHVTQIHRTGRLGDGIPFIVMEYIEGRTLSDEVQASGVLSVARAREVLASLAAALAAAHERGMVHRDVRPENVLVEDRTGRAVLGDFGIVGLVETGSETITQLTATGVRLGDVRYVSPEQLRQEPLTTQSDIYSFGVVAYEILTGQLPFDERAATRIAEAHLNQEPEPPLSIRAQIPGDLADLTVHCLAKDPQHRPTARELLKALGSKAGAADSMGAAQADGVLSGFLGELGRRRVYRIAVAYMAVGFAVMEGANNFVPALGLPDSATSVLAVLVVSGFPLALVLSWVYDIRGGGIHRTEESGGFRSRRLPWIGLAGSILLAAAIGFMLVRSR